MMSKKSGVSYIYSLSLSLHVIYEENFTLEGSSLMNWYFIFWSTISDKIWWEFENVRLKSSLSSYTMLWTHNIAWRKLQSLFPNIVKRGKGRET